MGCAIGKEEIPAAPDSKFSLSASSSTKRGSKSTDTAQRKVVKEAKVVLLGESGVGKSSLALRFCQGRFSSFHEVTIGAAFLQQSIILGNGNQVKLHIWDTGGQERFRSMAPLYYRDTDGAVIVYDCSNEESFNAIKFWLTELRDKGPPLCQVIVAANKSDVKNKQIDSEEARYFCGKNNLKFVECSARNGENVGALFELMANEVIKVKSR